jgi:preprotein translocase subunit SecF
LYFFGGSVINDFALILILGIVIGTYSSIFIASPIVLMFGNRARKSLQESASVTVV